MFSLGVLLTFPYKKELMGEVKQPKKVILIYKVCQGGEGQCKLEVLMSSLHYDDIHKLHLKKKENIFLLACSEFSLILPYVLDKVLTFSKR